MKRRQLHLLDNQENQRKPNKDSTGFYGCTPILPEGVSMFCCNSRNWTRKYASIIYVFVAIQ